MRCESALKHAYIPLIAVEPYPNLALADVSLARSVLLCTTYTAHSDVKLSAVLTNSSCNNLLFAIDVASNPLQEQHSEPI